MIALVKGRLARKDPAGTVIVDSGSVGYRVFVSLNTLMALPDPGSEVSLHTVTVVREDAMHLYGFSDLRELDSFNLLVQVKGVGPKLALALLSGLKADDLSDAIFREDAAWISAVPGVGKKTAERIILELKDKVRPSAEAGERPGTPLDEQITSDVVSALVNLGFKSADSRSALKKVLQGREDPGDFNDLIRECLTELSGGKI